MGDYMYLAQGIDIRTGAVATEFGFSTKEEYEAGVCNFSDVLDELSIKKVCLYKRGEVDEIFMSVSADTIDAKVSLFIYLEEILDTLD